MSGAGAQLAGHTPAGYGTPSTAGARLGSVFRDPNTSKQLNARRINATTGRYEFDSFGRIIGDSTARQMVKLAFATTQGTSVVPLLGHDLFSVKDITANFDSQIAGRVQEAVQDLIDQGLISLRSVNTKQLAAGRVQVSIQFVDLTTGEEQEVVI